MKLRILGICLFLVVLSGCSLNKVNDTLKHPIQSLEKTLDDALNVDEDEINVDAQESDSAKDQNNNQVNLSEIKIHFPFDSYEVEDQYRNTLIKIAEALQNNKEINLLIQGHADERGSTEYNLSLGQKRAVSVLEQLKSLGINPQHLEAISYGKEQPLLEGHNEEAWSQNRRVQFKVK